VCRSALSLPIPIAGRVRSASLNVISVPRATGTTVKWGERQPKAVRVVEIAMTGRVGAELRESCY
jgi:hypothetical protein